ncbi:Uncharacterised protein [Mycobacteroides abscessus subsp. abscessus]|nr:Uncharacterised protein [Mycobacteroides abscessus subsp. abscessus]
MPLIADVPAKPIGAPVAGCAPPAPAWLSSCENICGACDISDGAWLNSWAGFMPWVAWVAPWMAWGTMDMI